MNLVYWRRVGDSLSKMLEKPTENPYFVFYFFGYVLGIGGIGIWASLIASNGFIDEAVATYSLPIIAGVMIKTKYSNKNESIAEGTITLIQNILIFVGIASATLTLSISAVANLSANVSEMPRTQFLSGILSATIALLLVWIQSIGDPRFWSFSDMQKGIFGDSSKNAAGDLTDYVTGSDNE